MAEHGSGFDVVSGGRAVPGAGWPAATPGKTVFAGVGKTDEEIRPGWRRAS